jgi:hypothetical protein
VLAVVDAEKYKRGESVRHTSRLENPQGDAVEPLVQKGFVEP